MRIFAASLATETNSFSPIPTSRATYEQTMYFRPGEHPDRVPREVDGEAADHDVKYVQPMT